MKKAYTKPTAEKLAFRYRDQVVAASGDGNSSGNNASPSFGQIQGNEQWGGSCKMYAFEAAGVSICDIL